MRQKTLRHIIDDLFEKTTAQIAAALQVPYAEAMHRLRVNYKQLRAFLRMMSAGSEKEIRIPGKLRRLYQAAGKLRDLALLQQRLANRVIAGRSVPKSFFILLNGEIAKRTQAFVRFTEANPAAAANKKINPLLPPSFPASAFKKYITRQQTCGLALLCAPNYSDEHLHSIRKHYKDLFYNLNIYNTATSRKIRTGGLEPALLESLLDDLGNYQDQYTAIRLIQPGWLLRLQGRSRVALLRIKKEWIQEKKKTKKALTSVLHNVNGITG